MNSPTDGSTVVDASNDNGDSTPTHGTTDNGDVYSIHDGVAFGGFRIMRCGSTDPLDARVKCSKCNLVTFHSGMELATEDQPNHFEGNRIRVYGCSICGIITTRRG